ncbi:hypothetical protein B0A53_04529 [Rhodotorula sp. CCFEE 5036]|nr:hypothetical protein B0A53_04529 [Rhodotorula sp. CCFEE 5036]
MASLPGRSAAACAPLEVLEMIFQHLFTESQDVRTKIRLMTEIGLVCKAWMSAVEAVAVDILPLDPLDPEAVAYFDPAKDGPGAKLLPLVHSCCFVTMPNQCKDESAVGDAETELESEPGQDEPGSGPADPAQDDLESSFATLSRILAHMPNIQELMTAEGTESVIKRAFCENDPTIAWPRLVRMALFWGAPITCIYPILTRLSCLTDMASLDVWFSPTRDDHGDEDQEADDAAIAAAANQVQPLNHLQNFVVTAREADPNLLAPFVNLLSPAADAPLRTVSWLSRVPAGLFPRLSQGTQPLRRLTLGCFTRPEQYVREVWPQLRNLGQRPIMNLCVDLPSQADDDDDDDEEQDEDEDLTVEGFLGDLPPTIKLVETTRSAKEEDRDPYVFDPDFHHRFLSNILARPRAPSLTLHEDGNVSTSWKGKPRAQTVVLPVRTYSPDNVEVTVLLKLARYYNGPGATASLSEWHAVSPQAVDLEGDLDSSAGPEALTDLVLRGLIAQIS